MNEGYKHRSIKDDSLTKAFTTTLSREGCMQHLQTRTRPSDGEGIQKGLVGKSVTPSKVDESLINHKVLGLVTMTPIRPAH